MKQFTCLSFDSFFHVQEKPIVWNTYQCYLKQALNTISSEMDVVKSFGKCFGAKIVRGAYMEKERKLAKLNGYEDPVNDNYEATGEMYNRVVDYMMDIIANDITKDTCNIVVATHNEAGALHAASKMLQNGIPPDSGRVVFGQIYGMAEQISIPLASAGMMCLIFLKILLEITFERLLVTSTINLKPN